VNDKCLLFFRAAVFLTTEALKQIKCIPTGKWLHKLFYIIQQAYY
jgi:hypothetical protein